MSRKHARPKMEGIREIKDYTKSNHTKNEFKKWLNSAKYPELIDKQNQLREEILKYNATRAREGRIYPIQPSQHPIENLKVIKYKYNLICNQLNIITLRGK